MVISVNIVVQTYFVNIKQCAPCTGGTADADKKDGTPLRRILRVNNKSFQVRQIKKISNLRTDNIYDIVRFLFFIAFRQVYRSYLRQRIMHA